MIDFEMNDTDNDDEISLGITRIADLELKKDSKRDGNQTISIKNNQLIDLNKIIVNDVDEAN